MKNDSKKDPGQHDYGAEHIDFGTGTHTPFPTAPGMKSRPDAESAYSEFEGRNHDYECPASQTDSVHAGGLEMGISAKHNGGQKPSKAPTGM